MIRVLFFKEGRGRITRKEAKLSYRHITTVVERMLHARWHNDDITRGVGFCALIASAFAVACKHDDHLLGLVKVLGDCHTWTDDIFMNVRQRAELPVCDEIANTR